MKIDFNEVKHIFDSYKIWCNDKELFWYKKAWNTLEKGWINFIW